MYYQLRDKHHSAQKQLRISKVAGAKDYQEHKAALKDFIALEATIKRADAIKQRVKGQILKLDSDKSLSRLQKSQRIAELEKKENNAYTATIKKARALGIVN